MAAAAAGDGGTAGPRSANRAQDEDDDPFSTPDEVAELLGRACTVVRQRARVTQRLKTTDAAIQATLRQRMGDAFTPCTVVDDGDDAFPHASFAAAAAAEHAAAAGAAASKSTPHDTSGGVVAADGGSGVGGKGRTPTDGVGTGADDAAREAEDDVGGADPAPRGSEDGGGGGLTAADAEGATVLARLLFRTLSLRCHPDKTSDRVRRRMFVACNAAAKAGDVITLAAGLGRLPVGEWEDLRSKLTEAHCALLGRAIEQEERRQRLRERTWVYEFNRLPAAAQAAKLAELEARLRAVAAAKRKQQVPPPPAVPVPATSAAATAAGV